MLRNKLHFGNDSVGGVDVAVTCFEKLKHKDYVPISHISVFSPCRTLFHTVVVMKHCLLVLFDEQLKAYRNRFLAYRAALSSLLIIVPK